ncbi:uncharacterized protein LOC105756306 [Trichechus manatus latirostris]|uniref:Uncharacterized protein LOC105756306 n=1 Tax=Trichechus manatus latirostris TaxID=127582 RepID=A0A2Y9G0D4_TRIMA|nr:uncharacterized protein LOC105756306 [Trichechus manatus latirostris]
MGSSAYACPAHGPQSITPFAAAAAVAAAARADREGRRQSGGAGRAARPDSFLWGAGYGGAVRPQAVKGGPGGGGDNGFLLKGAARDRAASGGEGTSLRAGSDGGGGGLSAPRPRPEALAGRPGREGRAPWERKAGGRMEAVELSSGREGSW